MNNILNGININVCIYQTIGLHNNSQNRTKKKQSGFIDSDVMVQNGIVQPIRLETGVNHLALKSARSNSRASTLAAAALKLVLCLF